MLPKDASGSARLRSSRPSHVAPDEISSSGFGAWRAQPACRPVDPGRSSPDRPWPGRPPPLIPSSDSARLAASDAHGAHMVEQHGQPLAPRRVGGERRQAHVHCALAGDPLRSGERTQRRGGFVQIRDTNAGVRMSFIVSPPKYRCHPIERRRLSCPIMPCAWPALLIDRAAG
jgi:hypothetical protein